MKGADVGWRGRNGTKWYSGFALSNLRSCMRLFSDEVLNSRYCGDFDEGKGDHSEVV